MAAPHVEEAWTETVVLDSTRFMYTDSFTGGSHLLFSVLAAWAYPAVASRTHPWSSSRAVRWTNRAGWTGASAGSGRTVAAASGTATVGAVVGGMSAATSRSVCLARMGQRRLAPQDRCWTKSRGQSPRRSSRRELGHVGLGSFPMRSVRGGTRYICTRLPLVGLSTRPSREP
jgi:hypothetical protein